MSRDREPDRRRENELRPGYPREVPRGAARRGSWRGIGWMLGASLFLFGVLSIADYCQRRDIDSLRAPVTATAVPR